MISLPRAAALLCLLCAAWAGEDPPPFGVEFEIPRIPAVPDHSRRSPGPGGARADRAGYTEAMLSKSVGIAWSDAGRRDGKVLLFAQSVDVRFSMPMTIAVSSDYDKDGCPYDQTWKHELTHARAFQKIFSEAKNDLEAELERSKNLEPRVPTKSSPFLIDPKDAAAYEGVVSRKLRRIVDERARAMLSAMDKDRKKKDSAQAYGEVYDGCAAAEWDFRR